MRFLSSCPFPNYSWRVQTKSLLCPHLSTICMFVESVFVVWTWSLSIWWLHWLSTSTSRWRFSLTHCSPTAGPYVSGLGRIASPSPYLKFTFMFKLLHCNVSPCFLINGILSFYFNFYYKLVALLAGNARVCRRSIPHFLSTFSWSQLAEPHAPVVLWCVGQVADHAPNGLPFLPVWIYKLND